jgi:hypothetical protein
MTLQSPKRIEEEGMVKIMVTMKALMFTLFNRRIHHQKQVDYILLTCTHNFSIFLRIIIITTKISELLK